MNHELVSQKLELGSGSINSARTSSRLEQGPGLDSCSKFEHNFRLEVINTKARAQSNLISQSSIELFLVKKMVYLNQTFLAEYPLDV
jgi:hypothetical protein